MCMASGVTVSIHCFACWSTLEAILFSWSFHLLLDPGYRLSPASHRKCCFIWYVIPETLFFTGTRGIFTSKNWHVLVCTDKDDMDNHSLSHDSHTSTDLHFLLLYIFRYKFNPIHKVAVHFCAFPNYKTNLKIITFGLTFAKSTFKNQRHRLLPISYNFFFLKSYWLPIP